MESDGMEKKTALVTGASGGIGSAVARALAECGTAVAAVDRNEEMLQETVEKLQADGLTVEGFLLDVTSPDDVLSVVEDIEHQIGPLDFLVNTAGVLRMGEARSLTDEDWTSTFDVNATGVFRVSRAVVNRMVPRRRGAVVTVASNAAKTARMGMAAYAASKAAASMFTKCLGLEVAEYGIRCNLVAPGSTDTEMLRSMWHDGNGALASINGVPEAYRTGIPLRKLAEPADVAAAVLFLLSDQAAQITMHELTVDGGATLGV